MGAVEVGVVDPLDRGLFDRWHAALRTGRLAGRPPAPYFSAAEYHHLHTSPEARQRRSRVALVAVQDGEVVGAAEVSCPLRHDLATAQVDLAVPPALRGRGTGAALWGVVEALCASAGRTTLEAEVHVGPGLGLADTVDGAFALARGLTGAHAEDHFLLPLPVEASSLQPRDDPSGHVLESWTGPCPDDRVEAWAALQTTMAADAPHGELGRDRRVVTVDDVRASERSLAARSFDTLATMALTDDGEPAGYSLMFVGGLEPDHVHQDDTLVARAHRGHGLGLAMKRANHRVLAERHPDRRWVHTWTAQDNAPMQRVNRAFGYRQVETTYETARTEVVA